ncbi:MAG: hypothetical protein ACRD2C_19950 [Acidimicrobiales bacterium]
MCVNCLSTAEVVAGNVAVTVAVLKAPVHRMLADMGLVAAPDPVARDARTVAFLRQIELDPVEVLGADVVDAADRWARGGGYERRTRAAASARPIGSHSRLALQ